MSTCCGDLWPGANPLHQLFELHSNFSMENNTATEIQATNFFSADDHFVPPPNPDDDEWGTSGDMLEDEGDTSPTGNFTEMYEGCSEAFLGGKTFMDSFREDQYAEERKANPHFPFASQEEQQFASWLLRSRLSLTAIDSLLSLDIVSLLFY